MCGSALMFTEEDFFAKCLNLVRTHMTTYKARHPSVENYKTCCSFNDFFPSNTTRRSIILDYVSETRHESIKKSRERIKRFE